MKIIKSLLACVLITLTLTVSATMPEIISVVKFINHTASEIKKNQQAIVKIKEVVRSDCFKKELLSRKLIQTNNKTNEQVLEALLNAKINLRLSMYSKRFSSVNGYTYDGSDIINLNRKYHNNYGVCSVANNLAHEWSHKVGFSHDYRPNKMRPFSVPYSMNHIFEKCCIESIGKI